MALLWITLPFALLGAGLLAAGRFAGGGWAALDFLVYAMAVAALWALTATGWLVWIVLRDGWQASSAPAMLVLAALALLAAGWVWRHHAAEADCRAAHRFYAGLAAMPASERPAAIRAGGRFVTAPGHCALDGLVLGFGRSVLVPQDGSLLPDGERLAVLDALLDAGLPPADRLLYSYAVDDADADATRLLLQRRSMLNAQASAGWALFPEHVVQPLITRARGGAGTPLDPAASRYRATLGVFVAEGLPDPSALPERLRSELVGLGLLP